jgi:hypothetical protein
MHDPMVVAWDIRRPVPKRATGGGPQAKRWKIDGSFWTVAGVRLYFPSLITVWHVEPDGRDSGEVCKHYRREQAEDGTWSTTFLHGWKWHVHHWKIQVSPLQNLRRWLLTRCAWCGGRSRKRDAVNTSHSWDGPRGRWWRGEPGLFHGDCSTVEFAHRFCTCETPRIAADGKNWGWSECVNCRRLTGNGNRLPDPAWKVEHRRLLHEVPAGSRPTAEIMARAGAIYKSRDEAEEAS